MVLQRHEFEDIVWKLEEFYEEMVREWVRRRFFQAKPFKTKLFYSSDGRALFDKIEIKVGDKYLLWKEEKDL